MDRGFLEEMGIEKENVNKILDKYHEGIKEYKDSAEKVKTLEAENTSLKDQISQRDKDLKELKKVDAEELKTKISELEEKNKTMQETHDKEMSETRKNLMLENSLMKANVKNSKAIKGMLELDKITIENDELVGLEDQIKALKESDSYLFNIEEPTKVVDLNDNHNSSVINEPQDLRGALKEKYKS